jgi:hypothetical protein
MTAEIMVRRGLTSVRFVSPRSYLEISTTEKVSVAVMRLRISAAAV